MLGNRNNDSQIILVQEQLNRHIEDFNAYCATADKRWDALVTSQESNSQLIKELVTSNRQLSDSTQDIVRVWRAADGTVKTLGVLGKFLKWASGFTAIAVACKYVFGHIVR